MTVYALGLGGAGGAIATAEMLVIENGSIAVIERRIDARRPAPGANA